MGLHDVEYVNVQRGEEPQPRQRRQMRLLPIRRRLRSHLGHLMRPDPLLRWIQWRRGNLLKSLELGTLHDQDLLIFDSVHESSPKVQTWARWTRGECSG